jgi:predicted ATP-grasp superfamily ATP-dependent carboligase
MIARIGTVAVDTSSVDLIPALQALGTELEHKAVLFPCTDMSVLIISRNRHRLADHYHFVLPSAETVEMLMHKDSFYAYAQENGLPIPDTFILRDRADAERAATQLAFPAVLKPSIKTPDWQQHTVAKLFKAGGARELLEHYVRSVPGLD